MDLYFSGPISPADLRILRAAPVHRWFLDPLALSWCSTLPATPHLALNSGVLRAYETLTAYDWSHYCHEIVPTLRLHQPLAFALMPEILDHPAQTHARWDFLRRTDPQHTLTPVWHWNSSRRYLAQYLDEAPLVCVARLGHLMRTHDLGGLAQLQALCERHGQRLHLLRVTWLKAIEVLAPLVRSADVPCILDAARAGRITFIHSKTGHLCQAPAAAIPQYRGLSRRDHIRHSIGALQEFCTPSNTTQIREAAHAA